MKAKKKQVPILLYPSLTLIFFCLALLYFFGEPTSYVWVMNWDGPANMGHLIKMCPNGHKLFQYQLGVTGGIAIDPQNGTVWAPRYYDEHGVTLKQILKIGEDGTLLNSYSSFQGSIAALNPKDGSIWSGDTGRIMRFNSNGEMLQRYDGFEYPFQIVLDPRNNTIWVADDSNTDRGKLRHLYKNGIEVFSTKTNGIGSLAIDPLNGSVWYTDLHRDIYNLSADGNQLVKPAKIEGINNAFFVTVNPKDETVWVGEVPDNNKSGALVKLNSQGEITQKILLQDRPYFVEINPYDNNVWIGMWSKVLRLSADGKFLGQVNGFQAPQYIDFAPSNDDLLTKLKCAFYFYF
jgi:DNA-binding beta-propeller fold protein YncE